MSAAGNTELTEKNRKIIEGFYAAALSGDWASLARRMDAGIEIHEPLSAVSRGLP